MTHCSHGQLETVADVLWVPLFQNSENSEETTRNVAAACLGKLTTTNPSRYLPQLQVCQFGPGTCHLSWMVGFSGPYTRCEPSSKSHCSCCNSIYICGELTDVWRVTRHINHWFPFSHWWLWLGAIYSPFEMAWDAKLFPQRPSAVWHCQHWTPQPEPNPTLLHPTYLWYYQACTRRLLSIRN